MSDELDNWANELQEALYKEAEETYAPEVYKRWRDPVFFGVMENPSGTGQVRGSCGDAVRMYLRIEKGQIEAVSYTTDGCGPSIASGSMVAELAVGKTVEEAVDLSGMEVLDALGGLPEDSEHCAHLAAAALREAVDDYFRSAAKNDGTHDAGCLE